LLNISASAKYYQNIGGVLGAVTQNTTCVLDNVTQSSVLNTTFVNNGTYLSGLVGASYVNGSLTVNNCTITG
jgi:hypothetical protein